MSEGMIRVVGGRAAFQGPNEDRYVSSAKLFAYLRDRAASAEHVMFNGQCGDYAMYRERYGARAELVRAIEFVEKLLKGKEDE